MQNTTPTPADHNLATLLYATLGSVEGPSPWLVVPSSVLSLISLVGIALNSTLVYVTIRSR
jgi:hypothetical protein